MLTPLSSVPDGYSPHANRPSSTGSDPPLRSWAIPSTQPRFAPLRITPSERRVFDWCSFTSRVSLLCRSHVKGRLPGGSGVSVYGAGGGGGHRHCPLLDAALCPSTVPEQDTPTDPAAMWLASWAHHPPASTFCFGVFLGFGPTRAEHGVAKEACRGLE